MEMHLKFVTFMGDQEQFLVNAIGNNTAIELAIEANMEIGGLVDDENDGLTEKEVRDVSKYIVEDVDFNMLCEIIKRDDWLSNDTYVMAFRD